MEFMRNGTLFFRTYENRQSLLTRNAVTHVQIEKASKIFKPLLLSTEIERYAI